MPKQPVLRPREVVKILERLGFKLGRQKGSHCLYIKNDRLVTVPYHNKDLKPKTLKHIIKQAGIDVKILIKLK